ncbi:MAG: hypothetical protein ACE5Q6_18955 [Dehalococcoidia bacterium]
MPANVSHAEYQLLRWLRNQPLTWRSRVTGIKADISESPCALCSDTLNAILDELPRVKEKTLIWRRPFTGKNPTTDASLSRIQWDVTPACLSGKPDLLEVR